MACAEIIETKRLPTMNVTTGAQGFQILEIQTRPTITLMKNMTGMDASDDGIHTVNFFQPTRSSVNFRLQDRE
jgi:hypothetical protein